MKYSYLLFIILLGFAAEAFSGVFKQVDEHGNVTYTNVQSSNSKEVNLPPLVVVPSADTEGIDDRIRKRRENKIVSGKRKEIEQRIAQETEQLNIIKAEYKDGNPDRLGSERNYQRYLDRVERLKKEISMREMKLETLKRELEKIPAIQ